MNANETIVKPASAPDGDLACDFKIAKSVADVGFRERLGRLIRPPVQTLPDGVRAMFDLPAWDDVRRYVEVESQCCPFLSLTAERTPDTVRLTVTGRPEARDLIRNIFSVGGESLDCCQEDCS